MIQMGDLVRDSVTGLQGIVVAKTDYINGCTRVQVQPQEVKDGKPVDVSVFDEPQLVLVTAGAVKVDSRPSAEKTGGPRPDTAARREPSR